MYISLYTYEYITSMQLTFIIKLNDLIFLLLIIRIIENLEFLAPKFC